MAKFIETSRDVLELIEGQFHETSLPQYGVVLTVISVAKAKEVIKVKKASADAQCMTKQEDVIVFYVYEDAFDRLTDAIKVKLVEGALSNVYYDTEKEKLVVESDRVKEVLRMRRKYNDYLDNIEVSLHVIEQIAEEEKQRKEEEKARKAEEKAMRKKGR